MTPTGTILPGLGFIDPGCPVNWDHPDTAGLVAKRLAVPNDGWWGGKTTPDAVRGGPAPHDGTPVGSPGFTWTPFGQPALVLNGSSQYDTAAAPVAAPPLSMVGWFKLAATGTSQTLLAVGRAGQTDSWVRLLTNSTDQLTLNTGDSTGNQGGESEAGSRTAGVWFRAGISLFGPRGTIYLNGGQVGQGTFFGVTFNPFDYFAAGVLRFSSDIQFLNGQCAYLMVFNRELSPGWFARDYEWSQNPRRDPRLRRLRQSVTSSAQTVAPSGGPFPHFTRRKLSAGFVGLCGGC